MTSTCAAIPYRYLIEVNINWHVGLCTGTWKAWVTTRNDTCLWITLNTYRYETHYRRCSVNIFKRDELKLRK